jgi:hypothetical protein
MASPTADLCGPEPPVAKEAAPAERKRVLVRDAKASQAASDLLYEDRSTGASPATPPASRGSIPRPPSALVLPDASCSESEFVPGGLRTRRAHVRRRRGRRSTCPQGRVAATPTPTNLGLPGAAGAQPRDQASTRQVDRRRAIRTYSRRLKAGSVFGVAPGPTGGPPGYSPSEPPSRASWRILRASRARDG